MKWVNNWIQGYFRGDNYSHIPYTSLDRHALKYIGRIYYIIQVKLYCHFAIPVNIYSTPFVVLAMTIHPSDIRTIHKWLQRTRNIPTFGIRMTQIVVSLTDHSSEQKNASCEWSWLVKVYYMTIGSDHMKTSWRGNTFRIIGLLNWESTDQWRNEFKMSQGRGSWCFLNIILNKLLNNGWDACCLRCDNTHGASL